MKNEGEDLDINKIRINGGSQARATLDEETIAEYAEAMEAGATFPPITVFYDGEQYWLADGFHRRKAALKLSRASIAADIRQGTLRDAVLYSVGTNASHGLRRTNADKRRAVITLLEDMEWRQWSNREIARRCHVSPDLVDRLRASLPDSGSEASRQFVTKHGTLSTMQTANIGRSRSASEEEWERTREHLADKRESMSEIERWIERGDECETEEPSSVQAVIDEVLRALDSSRHDPLVTYRKWLSVRRQSRVQGINLSQYLYDRTEEEITDSARRRVESAYPDIDEEEEVAYIEDQIQHAEAARQAARPYGSFYECMALFEQVGMALVTHPDIQPHHERDVRRACHRLLEIGFGLAPPEANITKKKGGSRK